MNFCKTNSKLFPDKLYIINFLWRYLRQKFIFICKSSIKILKAFKKPFLKFSQRKSACNLICKNTQTCQVIKANTCTHSCAHSGKFLKKSKEKILSKNAQGFFYHNKSCPEKKKKNHFYFLLHACHKISEKFNE